MTEEICCPEGAGECSVEPGHLTPSEGHCPNCCPPDCSDCYEVYKVTAYQARFALNQAIKTWFEESEGASLPYPGTLASGYGNINDPNDEITVGDLIEIAERMPNRHAKRLT